MTLAFTAFALLAGLLGGLVVWRAPGRFGPGGALALGLATAAAIGATALVVLVGAGLDLFGAFHLVYLGVVISAPLTGAGLVVRVLTHDVARRWVSVAVVLASPIPVGIYATHIEPFRLVVEEVMVPLDSSRTGGDEIRIGVLADLQTNDVGRHESGAVDRLMRAKPDLILLPGDLFQGTAREFAAHEAELNELLRRLDAPHGVYFVSGDTDSPTYVQRALAGTDIVVLDNELVTLAVGDRTIELAGNGLEYATAAAVATRRALQGDTSADGGSDDGVVRILMAHRPDVVLDLEPNSRVDLVVAGHTHGGQIVIPGFGPPLTLSDVPRHVAAGGLHEVSSNSIYVSTGVGLERGQAPQIRLFSRPSIGILTLR